MHQIIFSYQIVIQIVIKSFLFYRCYKGKRNLSIFSSCSHFLLYYKAVQFLLQLQLFDISQLLFLSASHVTRKMSRVWYCEMSDEVDVRKKRVIRDKVSRWKLLMSCCDCCSHYDVADILCVTRCMVSRYVDEYMSPQLRASVLLLLELLFIRDGSFSCSLLLSHDIDELIDTVCTFWCELIIIIIIIFIIPVTMYCNWNYSCTVQSYALYATRN